MGRNAPSGERQVLMFYRTALLIPLFFALLFSQTLDTVIRFPEPVGMLFLNFDFKKLYIVGRGNGVYVWNCSTMTVQSVIPILTGWDPAFCSQHQKIYWAISSAGYPKVAVSDAQADTIIKILDIEVGPSHEALAYHRTADKLYVSGQRSFISLVDCATDSVIKTIIPPQGCWAGGFAFWDSIGNKVYVGSGDWSHPDWVMVVDCETDSVIKVIRSRVGWPVVAGYSPVSRKLYVGGDGVYGVAVIDCKYDTVIKRFNNIYSDFEYVPVYASEVNKVYWPSYGNPGDTIFVIDCDTDSIVRIIDKPLGDCIGVDCGCLLYTSDAADE